MPSSRVSALVRRFLPYLRSVRPALGWSIALVVVGPLLAASLLWLIKVLIDDVFIGGQFDSLTVIGTLYVIVIVGKLATQYAQTRIEASVAEQITQEVRDDVYRHVMRASPGSFGKRGVGDILTHLSGDVRRVEALIYTGLLAAFADIVGAIFFLGFLFILSWKLTLCALLIVPLLVLISWRISPRVRRASRISRHDETAWMALAEERLGAMTIVHAFGAQLTESRLFSRLSLRARRAELRTIDIQARMSLLVEGTAAVGGLLVMCIGAYEIRFGGLTPGTFIAFLGSIGSLYGPARGLAKATGRFQRAAAGAQRVADLLDTPSLVQEPKAAQHMASASGHLEFRNVSFCYTPDAPTIESVSLQIEPGERVAIVGPSGCGKSTLLRLALRLHDPSDGKVLIDGTDLRRISLDSLRRLVAPVFQEPFVVRGTIEDNIRYGRPEASDREVKIAAETANVLTFADLLPNGLATSVGPRGAWLSGGQRQRIALARALLCDAPILILDEAMAAVDGEAEELIQDAIERLSGTRTILMVGHRLSSIRRADRVVVMDHGRIVETGTPQTLLRPGTRYRDLFATQFPGEKAVA